MHVILLQKNTDCKSSGMSSMWLRQNPIVCRHSVQSGSGELDGVEMDVVVGELVPVGVAVGDGVPVDVAVGVIDAVPVCELDGVLD